MEAQIVTSQNKSSYDAAIKSLNDQLVQLTDKWEELLSSYDPSLVSQSEIVYENNLLIDQINKEIGYAKELNTYA